MIDFSRNAQRGAELSLPADGDRLWIGSDLHFDDERIRWHAKRPFRSICAMNSTLRDHWREAVASTSSVAGSRPATISPAERSSFSATTTSPGFDGGSARSGVDASVITLVIHADPRLLVTHVPLVVVPDGCVNVHGHHHDFGPLETGPWINVSVEQTGYRPLDVRTQVLPLARALLAGRVPEGATTIDRIRRAGLAN